MTSSIHSAPSKPSSIHFGHTGRVCVVTGGAQGIGAACVRRFAAEGAKTVVADLDDARGQALAAELGALYVPCDVGDKAQVDALVAQTLAAHGRIDVLVKIDKLNALHSRDEELVPDGYTASTQSMHYYDSMLVIEKRPRQPPQMVRAGVPFFPDLEERPSLKPEMP